MQSLWSAICVAGLWGFVLCTVAMILKAFPARESLERGALLRWGAALVFCFMVWVVGMAHA